MRAATPMRGVTWSLALALLFTTTASAQRRSGLREVTEWGVAGFSGGLALGGTSQQTGGPIIEAGGGSAFMSVFFDSWGLLSLRLEGSILAYGGDRVTVTNSYNEPIDVNQTTFLTGFHVGPQVTLGKGIFRPYGFGQVGFSYLFTETSRDDCYCEGSTLQEFDWSGQLGAGMMLKLGGSSSNTHLDVGARFLYGADSEYSAGPSTPPSQIDRKASVSVIYLGFTFGLRN